MVDTTQNIKTALFTTLHNSCCSSFLKKIDENIFSNFNVDFNSIEDLDNYLKEHGMNIQNLYYDYNSYTFNTCYYFEDDYIFIPMLGGISKKSMEYTHLPEYIKSLKAKMKELLKGKQYKKFYGFIDKKIRLDYFIHHYREIPKNEQLEIFEQVYSSIEDGFQTLLSEEIVNEILLPNKGKKTLDFFINETRAEILKDSNEIIVYRGEGDLSTYYEDGALSWTLDKKIAKFFAKRFNSHYPTIFQAKVSVANILTYISKESEVLIEPMDLIDVEEIDID